MSPPPRMATSHLSVRSLSNLALKPTAPPLTSSLGPPPTSSGASWGQRRGAGALDGRLGGH